MSGRVPGRFSHESDMHNRFSSRFSLIVFVNLIASPFMTLVSNRLSCCRPRCCNYRVCRAAVGAAELRRRASVLRPIRIQGAVWRPQGLFTGMPRSAPSLPPSLPLSLLHSIVSLSPSLRVSPRFFSSF